MKSFYQLDTANLLAMQTKKNATSVLDGHNLDRRYTALQ